MDRRISVIVFIKILWKEREKYGFKNHRSRERGS